MASLVGFLYFIGLTAVFSFILYFIIKKAVKAALAESREEQ